MTENVKLPKKKEDIKTKFSLGQTVITRNALGKLNQEDVLKALQRHSIGDWGEVEPEDWQANELSLKNEGRLFSVYKSNDNVKFWVITEWDRSITTVLLPEDY